MKAIIVSVNVKNCILRAINIRMKNRNVKGYTLNFK